MRHRLLLSFIAIVSLVTIASCVTIPSQTQLIEGKTSQASSIKPAECTSEAVQKALLTENEPALQLDTTNISLLNWNIYKAQRENWSEDFKSFIAGLDLVIIQEAINSPELTSLLDRQHPYWNLNSAFIYEGHEAGVLTASSTRPLFSCGFRTTEPLIRIPKTVLISVYPLANSDEKLLVANLHGINFTLGTEVYSEQIQNMIAVIEQHRGPMIVAGDFNTWSEARMDIVNSMVDHLSLQALAYDNQHRVKYFGHALDHVFYRGLEVTQEDSLRVTSSDHNPIKVSFRMESSQLALAH